MKKLLVLYLFLASNLLNAQVTNLFEKKVFVHKTTTLPYRILYPEDYNPDKKYPLLVFLHGAGERGDDNEAQLVHGAKFLARCRTEYPAIVIVPQCPKENWWSSLKLSDGKIIGTEKKPAAIMDALCALIKNALKSEQTDKRHVYVGGLSMGGMGTFEILHRMPKTFAAAFPICGGGDVSKVKKYAKHTALWIFHGAKDGVVPVSWSREMYEALKTAGAEVLYTEYPNDNHNSWDSAFKEEGLLKWLFSH
ncbi:MAG: dienelactone hydrolase family protein [Prevotellaceae bacterium]|jgi:predicted peptidase|nr:dienelactone hydrolase family protein [Prevotellaceae bacterium]